MSLYGCLSIYKGNPEESVWQIHQQLLGLTITLFLYYIPYTYNLLPTDH